jgi:hypothetical protein
VGYVSTSSAGCSGVKGASATEQCTITNQYKSSSSRLPGLLGKLIITNGMIGGIRTHLILPYLLWAVAGSSSGTTVTLKAGSYTVSESPVSGYIASYSPGCSGTIGVSR